ncbi:MAG: ferritin family protein, partial [Thermococcus sp.]
MDELEALALALEVEKAEMRFYLDLAGRTKDERARKMFLFLAREEADHWAEFEEKFLERVAEECKLP